MSAVFILRLTAQRSCVLIITLKPMEESDAKPRLLVPVTSLCQNTEHNRPPGKAVIRGLFEVFIER